MSETADIRPRNNHSFQAMGYELKQKERGECLECGTAIYGRSDKKFCSVTCKNAYHNNILNGQKKARNRTIAALTVNYDILDKLIKNNIRTIGIDRIKELGFDENYSTGHRHGRFNRNEESCFDITYYRTDAKIFHIRRKQ